MCTYLCKVRRQCAIVQGVSRCKTAGYLVYLESVRGTAVSIDCRRVSRGAIDCRRVVEAVAGMMFFMIFVIARSAG